jgi:hypothetical protein
MKVNIRLMTPRDYAAVAKLWRATPGSAKPADPCEMAGEILPTPACGHPSQGGEPRMESSCLVPSLEGWFRVGETGVGWRACVTRILYPASSRKSMLAGIAVRF